MREVGGLGWVGWVTPSVAGCRGVSGHGMLAILAGASGSKRALLDRGSGRFWAAGACSLCGKRKDTSPTIGANPRGRSTNKLAYVMADMGAVDWGDDNEIKGKVFKAVKYKASGKEHGAVGNKVDGLWARVSEVIGAEGGQTSNRYETLFFETEEAAQEGSGVAAKLELTFTLNALRGHAGVAAAAGGGDGGEAGGGQGEVAELSPEEPEAKKKADKKARQKANKQASGEALKAALAAVGLTKSDVLTRMRAAGVESVEEFGCLAGAGVDGLQDIATAAELAPMEKAALGKYMSAKGPGLALGDKYMGPDTDEDDEDRSSEDEAPPPKKSLAVAKGVAKGGSQAEKYPLMGRLLRRVPKPDRNAVAFDVLEGLCEALGKVPTEREQKNVMGSAEAKLKAMKFSVAQLEPAAPGGAEEVSMLVTELATAWEKPPAGGGRGGSTIGPAEGELAMVASGQQEPGMATALAQLLTQPEMLEKVSKLMASADGEATVKVMSEMGGDEAFAAISHKSGEVKVPAGVRQTHAVTSLVHGIGRMRQQRVEWVAGRLRAGALLPAGADALAVAWKIVAGDVAGIDLAKLYACEGATSMVGTLGGGSKAPRGDATADAMLVIVRGLAMLVKGYYVAHPFDSTVTATFAWLQAEVASAVQKGVPVEQAWKMLVDPFFVEVGRKWKEVGRLAGARPVLGVVAEEPQTQHALKLLREHAASCTPAVQLSAADAKKLRAELEASRATVADLKKQLAAKGVTGEPKGSKAEWEKANPGKCFFFTKLGKCTHGKACFNASQPGHPQHERQQ